MTNVSCHCLMTTKNNISLSNSNNSGEYFLKWFFYSMQQFL